MNIVEIIEKLIDFLSARHAGSPVSVLGREGRDVHTISFGSLDRVAAVSVKRVALGWLRANRQGRQLGHMEVSSRRTWTDGLATECGLTITTRSDETKFSVPALLVA